MSKLDNTPQPVREAIAAALMIGAVTATAASLLHEPLFIPGGFVLFLIFYFWRIRPMLRAAYLQQAADEAANSDDATYAPILARFEQNHNAKALVESYGSWAAGPHDNIVKLRFLQQAIVDMINAETIYDVEPLMQEAEKVSAEEGLTDRFKLFREACDTKIAEIAQKRLDDA